MGFFDHVFDSDYRQREDILKLQRKSRVMNGRRRRAEIKQRKHAEELEQRTTELEDTVGTLALMFKGLVGLMQEKGVWDDAVFSRICKEIDAADGVMDGKSGV